MMMKNLILASGSPRRKELLSLYTTDFTICVSDFDENSVTAPTPAQLVEKLARGKCLAVAKDHPGAVVLGCDTVVDVGGEVFGKPHSVEDAKRMLRALSGATHEVHTGVCVSDGVRTESFVDSCKVTFFPISEGGDRRLHGHQGTLRQGRCLRHPGPRGPLARPAGRGLLHHHGPARQPDGPSAEQILMRDTEKRPRRPKMKKLEKVYGNA